MPATPDGHCGHCPKDCEETKPAVSKIELFKVILKIYRKSTQTAVPHVMTENTATPKHAQNEC